MAMEENALQFINETGIEGVHAFISSPIRANLRFLIHAPALYAVANRQLNEKGAQINATTLEVFRWIYICTFVVFHQLTAQGSVPRGNIPPLKLSCRI
jgi:hypothetical protein